jgi:hypothetical protein
MRTPIIIKKGGIIRMGYIYRDACRERERSINRVT